MCFMREEGVKKAIVGDRLVEDGSVCGLGSGDSSAENSSDNDQGEADEPLHQIGFTGFPVFCDEDEDEERDKQASKSPENGFFEGLNEDHDAEDEADDAAD